MLCAFYIICDKVTQDVIVCIAAMLLMQVACSSAQKQGSTVLYTYSLICELCMDICI